MATDHPGPQPQVQAVLSEVVGGRAGAGHLVGRRHVVQHLLLGGGRVLGRVLEAARRRVPRVVVGDLAVGRVQARAGCGGGILLPVDGVGVAPRPQGSLHRLRGGGGGDALLQREQLAGLPALRHRLRRREGEGVRGGGAAARLHAAAAAELLDLRGGAEVLGPGAELALARPVDLLQELHGDREDVGGRRPRVVVRVARALPVSPRSCSPRPRRLLPGSAASLVPSVLLLAGWAGLVEGGEPELEAGLAVPGAEVPRLPGLPLAGPRLPRAAAGGDHHGLAPGHGLHRVPALRPAPVPGVATRGLLRGGQG